MTRPPPTRLTIVAVVLLSAVVALASHASVWAPPRRGVPNPAELVANVALIFGLGMAGVGAVTFGLHRLGIGRAAEPTLRARLVRAAPVAVVGLALVSLLAITRMDLQDPPGPGEGAASPSSGPPGTRLNFEGGWDTPVRPGEDRRGREGPWGADTDRSRLPVLFLLLGGVFAVCALASALWAARRARRPPSGEARDDIHREATHGAVVDAIDGMLADPDPATAIIGAYARLLEELSDCGAPRREYEGPMEHLHRVLSVLDARPEPLRRLIELFEVARFSTHALTPAHRERALGALRDVAADLGGPAATPIPAGSDR